MPKSGTWLAIDYGQSKTGLAVGHPLTGSAQPLEAIHAKTPEGLRSGLVGVIKTWQPEAIVVGLPLGPDGHETPMSQTVRSFAQTLKAEYPDIEIALHDERMTSVAAASVHAERRAQGRARQKDASKLDSMAACLILESWMASR